MPRQLAAVVVLLPFATMLLAPTAVHAAGEPNFIHVTTTDDKLEAFDQLCSLREAVQNANINGQFSPVINECAPGSGEGTDVIVLQSGMTYPLTRPGDSYDAGDLNVIDNMDLGQGIFDLRIESDGNAPATIQQTVPGQRVIEIAYAEVELRNLAILNGALDADHGGGIIANSNSLLLDHVLLSGNKAEDGGALAVSGNATLINSRVMFNEALGSGGGIWHTNGQLLIQGGLIQKNTAHYGGGGIASKGNLTIENAASILENEGGGDGGGIAFAAAANTSLSIRNTTIENNHANSYGGGLVALPIDDTNAAIDIENVVFHGNRSLAAGGAIASSIETKITSSTFDDNSAELGGGAIHSYSADITDSKFIKNSSPLPTGVGGAIWAAADTLSLKRSELIENSAGDGGAIYSDFQIDIQDVQFTQNKATSHGGAIWAGAATNLDSIIQRSSFAENSAQEEGGAIYTLAKNLVIANATLSANTAGAMGGSGIAVIENAKAVAVNVTLAGNGPSPAILKRGNLTLENSIVFSPGAKNCEVNPNNPLLLSLGNNFANDKSCIGLDDPSDQTGVGLDPMLAPLADNGGNTQTHALLDGSPAIDAGDGIACANTPVNGVDQRGFARTAGLNCDIGAYEKTADPIEQPIDLFKDGFE